MEYLNLVNQIVAAEQSAREIAREAQEQESSLEAELERETAGIRERYMERARRRVAGVEETEAKAAQEELARWDRRLERAMAQVESAYARNRDAWVETLFRQIVGEQA